MNTDRNKSTVLIGVHRCSSVAILFFLACGCAKPDKANIALRKQIQDLESQISNLRRQHEGDVATIRALQAQGTTVPTLPQERLDRLYTTHGLRIGRLTGGAKSDPALSGADADD